MKEEEKEGAVGRSLPQMKVTKDDPLSLSHKEISSSKAEHR